MASKERAPGPVVPVEHGSRPQLPKKKASIDFYRQLPFTRLKEKTTDQWQYAIASASGRAARFSESGIKRNLQRPRRCARQCICNKSLTTPSCNCNKSLQNS